MKGSERHTGGSSTPLPTELVVIRNLIMALVISWIWVVTSLEHPVNCPDILASIQWINHRSGSMMLCHYFRFVWFPS